MSSTAVHSSDFMGTDSIPRLLIRFSTPAAISSLINCIYNVVDRLYIGRIKDAAGNVIGPEVQAGLALTFPIMIIMMAFGMMIGQGTATVTSILLGEKRKSDAEKVLGQAFAMFLLFIVTVQAGAIYYLDDLLRLFGGTEQAIPYAHAYLSIILWGNIFQHISFGMSSVVRAEGSAYKAMYIILLGAVANIILDPIFIFCFDMGIRGAAHATVISMVLSSGWVLIHFSRGQGVIRLHLRNVRLFPQFIWRVLSIGISPFLMQFVHCAVVIAFNYSFRHYADSDAHATLAIGAFGIANSVLMLMLMPCFGIMMGMQPIVGYNTGARLFGRVKTALKLGVGSGMLISFLIAGLVALTAHWIALCFSDDPAFNDLVVYVLRTSCVGFTFIAPGMLTGNYFQSIGRAMVACIFSLSRQCIVLLPLLVLIPYLFGFLGIWWSGPCSDIISGLACIIMLMFELRRLNRLIAAKPDMTATNAPIQ